MDKIIITGGKPLNGTVTISGSKNAALPLMSACLLTSEPVILHNVPVLDDIGTMSLVLNHLGADVHVERNKTTLCAGCLEATEAAYDLVRKMRASVLVLGPLVARAGHARVSLPGGCAIGARPIDRHIKALEAMGAAITIDQGYVEARCKRLKGARIVFDDITVTGTENIMMAAALAEGETIIENAAREPEIPDLAELLTKMGAKIHGAGTSVITIEGVDKLHGAEHTVIPDRIEAGTYMMAAAMTQGDVVLERANAEHLSALVQKMQETGAQIEIEGSRIRVRGHQRLNAVDVKTAPYPGFATDFQAQFTAMMLMAKGTATVTETIFENRFMHVPELQRLGANIKIEGNTVIVSGVDELKGAPVMASDLRASASLVLAGLVAEGETELNRVYHLDRGYETMEKKLSGLGALVRREA